jgi:hypothetical protein
MRALRDTDRIDGALRISIAAAGQRRDGGTPGLAGDPVDRLEVAR